MVRVDLCVTVDYIIRVRVSIRLGFSIRVRVRILADLNISKFES